MDTFTSGISSHPIHKGFILSILAKKSNIPFALSLFIRRRSVIKPFCPLRLFRYSITSDLFFPLNIILIPSPHNL